MLEHTVNKEGQEQKIRSLDKIVKVGDKYLQVRLIQTQKWKNPEEFTPPMPRARFVDPADNPKIYYLVERGEVIKMNNTRKRTIK